MLKVFRSAWKERGLIGRLVSREVQARYRGSVLGLLWAVILPLATIAIYTFVFGTVFRARWSGVGGGPSEYSFGITLFVGFIVFAVFSEPFNRAPGLMLENPSYIKKIVFPLDILPWVAVATALLNAAISFIVFLVIFIALYGLPPITILLVPVVVLPVVFITLGCTYILSSLGVFIRDIRQFVPLLTTMMMFLSPVLYPLDNVPEQYRGIILLNPLTIGVVQTRDVIFGSKMPDATEWVIYLFISLVVLITGYAWFERTKKGFADVL